MSTKNGRRGKSLDERIHDFEEDSGTPTKPAEPTWRFEPIYSDKLEEQVSRPRWLVKRMLVANQPCIIGGPKKSLKTSILVDLAISLRSGTPFLDHFDIYHPAKVAILSGESGDFTIWQTGLRVCAARGLDYKAHRVAWQFKLPRLSDPAHVQALAEGLAEHKIEVAGIDPLYLCLLSNAQGRPIDPANLYEMGPLFLAVSEACLGVGCTPILSHHAKKNTVSEEPLGLEDLAYAGVSEFARQWVLLNPRESFDPETGTHKLWMTFGGSMGQSGVFGLDVIEGTLDDDFSGRGWDVSVIPAGEMRIRGAEQRETEREQRLRQQVRADGTKLLNAMDELAAGGAAVFSQVRTAAHLSNDRMTRAVLDLTREGIVEEVPVEVAVGKGLKTKKTVKGLCRTTRRPTGPTGQTGDCPDGPVGD